MKSPKNLAILVQSCDSFSDLWNPFFSFLFKNWPDCPYNIYLTTNELVFNHHKVITINTDTLSTWSERLSIAVELIQEDYVLLLLEDYFIYKPVNTSMIESLISTASENDSAYFKIACFPPKYDELWPNKPFKNYSNIAEILPGAKYRVDTQIALWNKKALSELILKKESIWQFEINASVRSVSIDKPFLMLIGDKTIKYVHGPVTYYCTAVSRGKWMRGAIKLCKKEGISIDISKRKTETLFENIYRSFYISLPLFLRKLIDYTSHIFRRNTKKSKYSQ